MWHTQIFSENVKRILMFVNDRTYTMGLLLFYVQFYLQNITALDVSVVQDMK